MAGEAVDTRSGMRSSVCMSGQPDQSADRASDPTALPTGVGAVHPGASVMMKPQNLMQISRVNLPRASITGNGQGFELPFTLTVLLVPAAATRLPLVATVVPYARAVHMATQPAISPAGFPADGPRKWQRSSM